MSLSNREFSESKILRPINLESDAHNNHGNTSSLMLAAIGIVFGDIGTSPLYALKECFSPEHGIPFSPEAVFGVISMVFWAFLIVVSLKYVLFVMRANNNGEGGILALMALALRTAPVGSRRASGIMMLGVFGACMFYGDVVEIAGKIGAVEEVTLRYIRLRDYEGVVHFVPNNAISVVTNRSRNFLYAVMDVCVAYKTDLTHLNQTLIKVAKEMRDDPRFTSLILDDLEIAGLDNFGESSIVVRCRIKVDTSSQMLIKREFQGRLKLAFEQEEIEIPYRHLVIQQHSGKTPSNT